MRSNPQNILSEKAMSNRPTFLPSFARANRCRISQVQQDAYEVVMRKFSLLPQTPAGSRGISRDGQSALHSLCSRYDISHSFTATHLEIGFGAGEHLVARAKAAPETLFIGCEPFLGGVAAIAQKILEDNITNIRIFRGDARLLMRALPAASIEQIYLLYPDPWPKRRHYKRRIVTPETLDEFHRLLAPEKSLLIATDHVDYSAWIAMQLLRYDGFEFSHQYAQDFLTPPADWPGTRYEAKAKQQGRVPVYFEMVKSS